MDTTDIPLHTTVLPDGRWLTLELCRLGPCLTIGSPALIDDLWIYATWASAEAAARTWDGTGEPPDWTAHPLSGRTRPTPAETRHRRAEVPHA